ncbi:hypothetical protein WJX79_008400 [Trebouxia sp. C0005]
MVKVGRCDTYLSCLWDDSNSQYYLDGVDCRETRIGHWTSLDGSKPGFSEIENEDFDAPDEQIMQGKKYFDVHSPDKEEVSEYPGGQDQTFIVSSVSRLDARSLAAHVVDRMCDRGWQGLDCASMSALLSVLDLGFEALLMFQGDVQHMWAGKVHSLAIDVAILLVHCALRTKLEGCGENRPSGLDATLQQRFVLASVQAFTRCLAAPGGLQHTGLRDAYSDLTYMFIQQKEAFPVEQVLAPACAQMTSRQDNAKLARSPALLKLLAHCMTELQQLTAHPPDWALNVACPARKCKCRRLCQDLVAFLHHPKLCVPGSDRHSGLEASAGMDPPAPAPTITAAVKEVMLLLISEAIRASPSQRS